MPGAELSALAGCGTIHQLKQVIQMMETLRDEWIRQAIARDGKFNKAAVVE